MKLRLLAGAAAISGAIASHSPATCDPSSVFVFGTSNSEWPHEPALSVDQSQQVLAHLVGASGIVDIQNEQDARLKALFGSTRPFSSRKSVVAGSDEDLWMVVTVEGLSTDELLGQKPTFTIEQGAGGNFFENFFDSVADHLQEIKSAVFNRDASLEDHEEDEESAHLRGDIAMVKQMLSALHASESRKGDTRFKNTAGRVHLTALSHVKHHNHKYQKMAATLKKELESVIAAAPETIKILVVALGEHACRSPEVKLGEHHGHKHGHKHLQSRAELERRADVHTSAVLSPAGFVSQQVCEQATNACSGHGSCVRGSAGRFTCSCEATFNSTTHRTTRWGGAACQKIDISTEFHLLFWTALGLIVVAGAGVALLFSVGNDPLPGVLGVAKKSQ